MSKPIYEFEKVTTSANASPAALIGSVYWYDTGTEVNDEAVYYDASDTYAYWNNATSWLITIVADVDTVATNKFTLAGSTFTGAGAFTGTLTLSENTIQESWNKAERAVFTSLLAFVGGTERVNAFRGRFPENDQGEPKFRNIWKIDSGGSAGAFEASRTYGENGNWCNVFIEAEIEGYFNTRVKAMNFASCVLAWLKSTDNLKTESGSNVNWCMLAGLPEAPTPTVGVKQVMWSVTIPLQILYLTEGEY